MSPQDAEARRLLSLIDEGERECDGLCTKFDGCWHCGVLAALRALTTRANGYPPPEEVQITAPSDGTDAAIRLAALVTASKLGLFAATWPEFFAFGLAVKRALAAPREDTEARLRHALSGLDTLLETLRLATTAKGAPPDVVKVAESWAIQLAWPIEDLRSALTAPPSEATPPAEPNSSKGKS